MYLSWPFSTIKFHRCNTQSSIDNRRRKLVTRVPMDVVSGAASVLTLAGLALSSTREIYKFVSSIKNGPRIIRQLTTILESLLKLLENIETCTDPLYPVSELAESVSKCARELETLKVELGKLHTIDTNRAIKLWRKIKTVLKEQDLERMSGVIHQHVAALSIRIQMIEGY